jgi:UDP-N-acetylmuramoyl-L-alanyl-D-glutamate--2,6-diaminopimelate ligase
VRVRPRTASLDSNAVQLERLIAALGPREVVGDTAAEVRDLAYDSRAVGPGSLFFCVPGERADGHDFGAAAVEHGAVALVVERILPRLAVPQLVVTSARASMAAAADEFFGRPTAELEVVGVTGTNGKTTTTYLVFSILEAAGRRPGLLGTIESRIGSERQPAVRTTAEAIDLQRAFRAMLEAGNRSAAIEATSHGSELRRLDRVRFAALVFTNLTQDHLDFHGTMERYFQAKRRLFVEGHPPAAVNVGDPYGRRLAADLPEALTFGRVPDAEIGPEALEGIDLKLRGDFNVENALGAIATARLLGIDEDAVARGLEAVHGVPGRFEQIEEGQPFAVVVDYSHKPDALASVLRAARGLAENRVLCVFGCGGDRDRGKRPLMGRIASELADVAIVTSDNPRSEDPLAIIDEILAGATAPLEVEPDRRTAIERALALAREGDIVLIAGKGHERGQEIAGEVLPFDDRDVARDALRRLGAPA